MGPQGSGKSTLAQMIVRGANGTAAHVEWEDAQGISNAAIRARFAKFALVCVEACEPACRHNDLKAGDSVLMIHGLAPTPTTLEASHAG